MARKRPRTTAPKDFLTPKQRVGKKKLTAPNQLLAVVKEKAVKVLEQRAISRATLIPRGKICTSKNLSFSEVISQTAHHNTNVRREAALQIKELIEEYSNHILPQIGHLLSSVARLAADSDPAVRQAYRQILEKALCLCRGGTYNLNAFAKGLGRSLRCCLTHRDVAVRFDAMEIAEILLKNSHCFSSSSHRQIFVFAGGESSESSVANSVCDLMKRCIYPNTSWKLHRVAKVALNITRMRGTDKISRHDIALANILFSSDEQVANRSTPETAGFVQTIVDIWAKSKTLENNGQSGAKICKGSQYALRQIQLKFGQSRGDVYPDVNRERIEPISFNAANDNHLISGATRLILAELLLELAQANTDDDEVLQDVKMNEQNSRSLCNRIMTASHRLFYDILIDAIKPPSCPSGVHEKIFSEIVARTSMTLVQLVCVLLLQKRDDIPTLQTSLALLLLMSESLSSLSSCIQRALETKSRRSLRQSMFVCQGFMQLGFVLIAEHRTRLIHQVLHVVASHSADLISSKAKSVILRKLVVNRGTESTGNNSADVHTKEVIDENRNPNDNLFTGKNFLDSLIGKKMTEEQLSSLMRSQMYTYFYEWWSILGNHYLSLKSPKDISSFGVKEPSVESRLGCPHKLTGTLGQLCAETETRSLLTPSLDKSSSKIAIRHSNNASIEDLESSNFSCESSMENSGTSLRDFPLEQHKSGDVPSVKRRRLSNHTEVKYYMQGESDSVNENTLFKENGNSKAAYADDPEDNSAKITKPQMLLPCVIDAKSSTEASRASSNAFHISVDTKSLGILRVMLIPQICLFWGIPPVSMPQNLKDSSRHPDFPFFTSALYQISEMSHFVSTPKTHTVMFCNELPQLRWVVEWVQLAASLVRVCESLTEFTIASLLALVKHLEFQNSNLPISQQLNLRAFYRDILLSVEKSFLKKRDFFSRLSQSVRRGLMFLCAFIVSKDGDCCEFLTQDTWRCHHMTMTDAQIQFYIDVVLSTALPLLVKLNWLKSFSSATYSEEIKKRCLNEMPKLYREILSL